MNWYSNLKLGTKMILGFLIVALIAGGIGVMGIINIREVDRNDAFLYEQVTVPLGEMIFIAESFQRMRGNLKDIVMASSEAEILDYEKRIEARNKEFHDNLTSFQTTLFTEEGKKLVGEVFDIKSRYDVLAKQVIAFARAGQSDQAIALLNGEMNTLRTEIEEDYRRLWELKVEGGRTTSDNNHATTAASVRMTIILIVLGMAISIALGYFISSSIRKPISKMVDASKRMANGDLDVTLDIQTKDEIGILADAFRTMADNMNEVLINISAASDQVASGSRQVSDSSMSLSQGATEQASSIQQLTASIEEISAQTRQNAENANEAKDLAENARGFAVKGNDQMDAMLKSMDEINESSNSISKIIKVIDEIAFQTNILALNAAVEAARAGQHGKGFAVVAEEVRNLAARSANAAKETTAMIEGSIQKVAGGTKIANETAVALEEIVKGIEKASNLVAEIAVASNEQALGVEQINQGIGQIADVVQTTSATSEETAAASEELSSQAEMLQEQVSRFKLRTGQALKPSKHAYSDINPEVLKMLDALQERNSGPKEAPAKLSAPSKKIVLSDKDFGKY